MLLERFAQCSVLVLCFASIGSASSFDGSNSAERQHLISIGAGVTSPSVTSALGENPAGLIYNERAKFLVAGEAANNQFNPLGFEAGFFVGNGKVGAGLAYQEYTGTSSSDAGTLHVVDYGLSALIEDWNIAFGIGGTYFLTQTGSYYGGMINNSMWDFDLGMIINPTKDGRFGITVYGVLDSVDAIGLGYAYDLSNYATFAVDATCDRNFNGKVIKPTLGITMSSFQFAVGYGFNLDNTGYRRTPMGVAFAMGVEIVDNVLLQLYFNQIARYYAGVTFRI